MSYFFLLCVGFLGTLLYSAKATNFHVTNNCDFTICAKYWSPNNGIGGGCAELVAGGSWDVAATPAWSGTTVWGIPGDCLEQECDTGPPSGVSQFEITVDGQRSLDYYDISLMAGFNLGMSVTPTNDACPSVECAGPSEAQCPNGTYPGNSLSATEKNCAYGSSDYHISFISDEKALPTHDQLYC